MTIPPQAPFMNRLPVGVADAHNDLLMLVCRRPPHEWTRYFRQHWYPQLRAGGVKIQVLPVFVDREFRPEGSLRETLRMIEAAHRIAEAHSDLVTLCRSGSDIDAALAGDKIALVLALEGCPQVGEDLELLELFARLGVRMVSFTHYGRSPLGDGSAEDHTNSRLTSAGVEAIALLESLGVHIDISHLGASGVAHVLEVATKPVIASHSAARSVFDHHRNLGDDQLRGIRDNDGLVCLNLYAGFLADSRPRISDAVRHCLHLLEILGIDRVGIGSDFCKEIIEEKVPSCDRPLILEDTDTSVSLDGLDAPSDFQRFTAALFEAGLPEQVVTRIGGGNLARFLGAEIWNC